MPSTLWGYPHSSKPCAPDRGVTDLISPRIVVESHDSRHQAANPSRLAPSIPPKCERNQLDHDRITSAEQFKSYVTRLFARSGSFPDPLSAVLPATDMGATGGEVKGMGPRPPSKPQSRRDAGLHAKTAATPLSGRNAAPRRRRSQGLPVMRGTKIVPWVQCPFSYTEARRGTLPAAGPPLAFCRMKAAPAPDGEP